MKTTAIIYTLQESERRQRLTAAAPDLLAAAKALSACAETEYWSSDECHGLHLLRQAIAKAEDHAIQ